MKEDRRGYKRHDQEDGTSGWETGECGEGMGDGELETEDGRLVKN